MGLTETEGTIAEFVWVCARFSACMLWLVWCLGTTPDSGNVGVSDFLVCSWDLILPTELP